MSKECYVIALYVNEKLSLIHLQHEFCNISEFDSVFYNQYMLPITAILQVFLSYISNESMTNLLFNWF